MTDYCNVPKNPTPTKYSVTWVALSLTIFRLRHTTNGETMTESKMIHMQIAFRAYKLGMVTAADFKSRPDGTPYTDKEVEAYIETQEANGIDCFPCCDNVDEHGRCKGTDSH